MNTNLVHLREERLNKMKKAVLYSLFFSVYSYFAYSQNNTSIQLEELVIEKNKISKQSKSQHSLVLNDSLLENSIGTFTDFLQKNTTIYFKENGYGMVSSPSFRGTTAQQTSVLWNGIKINSALLGQTDFNSTAFKGYDNIVVKPGGGSVLYGSSAIGGTIHLNNQLTFNRITENEIQLNYGSFNTQGIHYKISTGFDKFAINAHFGYNKSDNDYEWIGKNRKNINGQFYNTDFGIEAAYKINSKNTVELYSATYQDERYFALLTPYETKTKYQNNSYRNLFKWHHKTNSFLNTFHAAYMNEWFGYFDDITINSKSGGKAHTLYFKNESFYNVLHNFKMSGFVEYQRTNGEGENSGLPFSTQEIFAVSILGNFDFTNHLGIEVGAKNEVAKDYENPFLFSAGFYFNSELYQLKINTSKNYRIPTFNDLYWQPGGNLNLKPETSYQFDINNNIKFKSLTFNFSTYYTTIKNMIRWVPTSTGFWEANNADEVAIYGADVLFSANKNWNKHSVSLNSNYSYTKSIDKKTEKQLTYTPVHKFNIQLCYTYKKFSIAPAFLYVGELFTTASNDPKSALNAYGIVDLDLQQKINIKNKPFLINLKIKNAANTVYTNMPERLMPGRNYHIQLIKKF